MKQLNNWESIKANTGEYQNVEPNGYIAIIHGVQDKSDREYLSIELDIAEGQFKGYYGHLFINYGFWGLTSIRSYKEKAQGMFKHFINCVESSNPSYTFNWNEQTLEGKSVGIVLREEEYLANNGDIKTRLIVDKFKTVDEIKQGKFKVLDKKLYKGNTPTPTPTTSSTTTINLDDEIEF